MLDAVPATIAWLNQRGEIVLVNDTWRRFACENGYARGEDGTGANYLAICQSDESARDVTEGIRRVLHGESDRYEAEYPCATPSRELWFRMIVVPWQQEGECGAVVMHVDVTDRRMSEYALQDAWARTSTLLETAPDAILSIDLSGTIATANPATEEMFGFARRELIGAQVAMILPELGAGAGTGLTRELARVDAQFPRRVEATGVHQDQTRFPISLSIGRYTLREAPMLSIIARDISERKRVEWLEHREAELRELERMLQQRESDVTARIYGHTPLAENSPLFAQLVKEYGDVVELSLEERGFRTSTNRGPLLTVLADRLGFLRALPRDVIAIHTQALRDRLTNTTVARSRVYLDEARLVLLRLMGYLAAYYRSSSLPFQSSVGVHRKASETRDGNEGDS